MKDLIYRFLAVLVLFVVSCSEKSNILQEELIEDENFKSVVYKFGGSGNDVITNIIQADDSGLVLIGHTNSIDGDFEDINSGDFRYDDSNAFIMKLSLEKDLEWVKTYGGDGENVFDHVFKNGNGYTVFGRSNSLSGDFEGFSSFKAELDSNGALVSVSSIHEDLRFIYVSNIMSNTNLFPNGNGHILSLNKINNCCYLATGQIYSGRNILLLKVDENLSLILSKEYEGEFPESDWGVASLNLHDGFLVAGNTQSNQGIFEGLNNDLLGNSSTNVFLMKTDHDGEIEWLNTFGGRERDELITLTKGNENNYIIGGNNETNDGDFEGYGGEFQRGINQIFLISIDSYGNKEWINTFGGSGYELLENLVSTYDGRFLMSGLSTSNDGDFSNSGNGYNFLMKVNHNGERVWVKKFSIPDLEREDGSIIPSEFMYQNKAIFSMQNSYFMVFHTNRGDEGKQIILIEVDQNGNFVE